MPPRNTWRRLDEAMSGKRQMLDRQARWYAFTHDIYASGYGDGLSVVTVPENVEVWFLRQELREVHSVPSAGESETEEAFDAILMSIH